MATQIVMPPLGDTTDEARLVRWLKKEGDPVEKGDILFEVETDKATLVVEAYSSGILRKILVGDDTVTEVGAVLGWIAAPDEELPE